MFALIFGSCALFTVYHQPYPTPLQVITTRAREGGPKEHGAKQKRLRETHSVNMYQGSSLFPIIRVASAVINLLPKATFTPSIQPNLGLPRTRPPLASPINTLLAILYSSILSTCPIRLNTLRSALLANFLSIPALLRTSSFLTLSIRNQTSQTLHLKNIHFNSLSTSHTPSRCSVQRC